MFSIGLPPEIIYALWGMMCQWEEEHPSTSYRCSKYSYMDYLAHPIYVEFM